MNKTALALALALIAGCQATPDEMIAEDNSAHLIVRGELSDVDRCVLAKADEVRPDGRYRPGQTPDTSQILFPSTMLIEFAQEEGNVAVGIYMSPTWPGLAYYKEIAVGWVNECGTTVA